MSELSHKSPELLQAQLVAFATEGIAGYDDKVHLFNNLGALAVSDVADVIRVVDSYECGTDENGRVVVIPEGTERLVATENDYTSFLRSVGGSSYEFIQGRADMLKLYTSFAPIIDKLRTELVGLPNRKEHPAYLGDGSTSTVFSITFEGKAYAARVPNSRAVNARIIDSHMESAVLGKGVPRLEQIVAASYEDGVTVAEIISGKVVGDLTVDEIKQMTDGQLGELVDTVCNKSGILIDPKPSNILYDPEVGFGIVDYNLFRVSGKRSTNQALGEAVGWMASVIKSAGFYGKPFNPVKNVEDYSQDRKFYEANLDVLRRYREVVEKKLTGEDCNAALKAIDSGIKCTQATVDNYSSTEWVAKRVAQDRELQREHDQRVSRFNMPKPDGVQAVPVDVV